MEIAGFWDNASGQQSAQSWFEKGEAALCGDRHSEAAICFAEVLKADPFNAKAHCRIGNVYWAQGKTEDALNAIKRALELQPWDSEIVLACHRIFTAFGKTGPAKELLQLYLEKNPGDSEIRSKLESHACSTGHDPQNGAAEFLRRHGELQFGRGDTAHATACFEMAIEEDPRMAEAYNNLGVIKLESGRVMEALENFRVALALNPDDIEILGNSARGLARAAQIEAAIEVYREYLRRSPQDGKAWQEFEFLVRQTAGTGWSPNGLAGEVADIYLDTAEKLQRAGDLAGAAEAVEKSLRIKPAAPRSLYMLASLHCAVGQNDEAEKVLEQALAIDPSHGPSIDLLESIRRQVNRKCEEKDLQGEKVAEGEPNPSQKPAARRSKKARKG
jgi:tetratricopeptide (TPR) repeat protein